MSLLLNASPWTSTTETTTKKRIPTIKKSMKSLLNNDHETGTGEEGEKKPDIEGFSLSSVAQPTNVLSDSTTSSSINDHIKIQEDKNSKINQLIENMTNLKVDNGGDSLYNYTPSSDPVVANDPVNRAVPIFQRNGGIIGQGVVGGRIGGGRGGNEAPTYEFTAPDNLANLVNYSKAYEIPKETRPYYTQKLGIGNSSDSFEEKILDKIQYLTHLMEEIQSEKTANVTEEFILYTMLGVFVIYVVDAFSKSGKYIR